MTPDVPPAVTLAAAVAAIGAVATIGAAIADTAEAIARRITTRRDRA